MLGGPAVNPLVEAVVDEARCTLAHEAAEAEIEATRPQTPADVAVIRQCHFAAWGLNLSRDS